MRMVLADHLNPRLSLLLVLLTVVTRKERWRKIAIAKWRYFRSAVHGLNANVFGNSVDWEGKQRVGIEVDTKLVNST